MYYFHFNNEPLQQANTTTELFYQVSYAVERKRLLREPQKCLGYLYLSENAHTPLTTYFGAVGVHKPDVYDSSRIADTKYEFPTGQFVTLQFL